jgi:hypothetical protein
MTGFFITRQGETISVTIDAVLPFSSALEAANELFCTKNPPGCVDWLKL